MTVALTPSVIDTPARLVKWKVGATTRWGRTLPLVFVLAACLGSRPRPNVASLPVESAVTRIYDARRGQLVTFDAFVRRLDKADVIFFGEQHDDPVTHAVELAFLAALGARRPNLTLSLEMFERDVQGALDAYLRGTVTETDFLAATRPWDRYATDYRGMVELARVRGWPVVAANIPRPLASAVSRAGLAALDTIAASNKPWIAREHHCPRDDEYFTRFAKQMEGHRNGAAQAAADTTGIGRMTQRFYDAQCAKDEAMGEAVADAWRRAGPGALVVHYDGAFHSDYRLGTAERVRRRLPSAQLVVVSAIPVAALDSLDLTGHQRRADFLVFTKRLPKGTPK